MLIVLPLYILRELGRLLALTLLIVSFIIIPFFVGSLVRQSVGLWTILQVAPLIFPYIAGAILPFSIVFGTILCYGRLGSDNEYSACMAGGVWPGWVVSPAFLVGLVLTFATIYLNASVLTYSTRKTTQVLIQGQVDLLEKQLARQGVVQLANFHLYRFPPDDEGREAVDITQYADAPEGEGNMPKGFDDETRHPRVVGRYVALDHKIRVERGVDEAGTVVYIDLYDASVQTNPQGDLPPPSRGTKATYEIRPRGEIRFSISTDRVSCWGISKLLQEMRYTRFRRELSALYRDGKLSLDDFMEQLLSAKLTDLGLSQRLAEKTITPEVFGQQSEFLRRDLKGPITDEEFDKSMNKYRRALHNHLALSFSCFLFAIVGTLVGLAKQRGQRSERIALGFFVAAIYFLFFLLCRSLSDLGAWLLWLPNLGLGVVIAYYWRRLFWVV